MKFCVTTVTVAFNRPKLLGYLHCQWWKNLMLAILSVCDNVTAGQMELDDAVAS